MGKGLRDLKPPSLPRTPGEPVPSVPPVENADGSPLRYGGLTLPHALPSQPSRAGASKPPARTKRQRSKITASGQTAGVIISR